jgi:hypothetical protein
MYGRCTMFHLPSFLYVCVSGESSVLHVPNEINQFGFLAGQTDNFHIKDNGRIGGDAWFPRRTGSSLFPKGQIALSNTERESVCV